MPSDAVNATTTTAAARAGSGRCALFAASAAIVVFSVICALYRLAVTLPAEYAAATVLARQRDNDSGNGGGGGGGAAAAFRLNGPARRGRSTGGKNSASAGRTGESLQSAATSAWSSILSLGGGGSSGSGSSSRSGGANAVDERLQQRAHELMAFAKLGEERAKRRRSRTTPRDNERDGGGDDDEARQVEATLGQTRWPHNHAVPSASRTGLLPQRAPAVRARYDELHKRRRQQQQPSVDANLSSSSSNSTHAPLPALCGLHAQAASTHRPASYTGAPLNSRSRVVITGIVSTSVGYHLALHLAAKCRVSTIVGIDAMYPNTLEHRLAVSHRMARLHNALRDAGTELVRPVVLLSHVGVDPGLSGGSRGSWPILSATTGEVDYVRRYRPTHIVHLAGTDAEAYRDDVRGGSRRGGGPDGGDGPPDASEGDGTGRIAPLLTLRQRAAGLEQLLEGIARGMRGTGDGDGLLPPAGPHLTYASAAAAQRQRPPPPGGGGGISEPGAFHRTAAAIEETLAATYGHADGVYSVGMRLPTIYGPMAGRPGVARYDVVEAAVRSWGDVASARSSSDVGRHLLNRTGHSGADAAKMPEPYLHVDDAVDAIVAAMQYRRPTGEAVVFDVAANEDSIVSLQSFAEAVASSIVANAPDEIKKYEAVPSLGRRTAEYLAWSPSITFSEGISTLVSWHLEQKQPFGPPNDVDKDGSTAWRKSFHSKFEELSLRRGRKVLPCASECVRSLPCAESVFDSILHVTRDLTEGCDTVFYSSTWNISVTDLPIETSYLRNVTAIPEICNLAFVPADSPLVQSVISRVRESTLKRLGLSKTSASKDGINALNGRLLHKGWILVFVESPSEELDSSVKNLLKLSPRRMFASTVTKGVFVDGIFTKPAKPVDALFLATMLRRDATKAKEYIRHGDDGRTYKILIPPQPRRRAIMVAPIMRHPTLLVNATVDPSPNIGMKTAVKVMILEAGLDPSDPASAPSHFRRQMESYQYTASILNRKELRSSFEPNYLYESQHWISSKSLVHDFTREEGRQLRCEVYEEHSLWGNAYDQLSFNHVMATRKLRRQLHRDEPDAVEAKSRREKMTETDLVKERVVNSIVDWHQWHSLVSEGEKAGRVPSPPTNADIIEDVLRVKKILPERDIRKSDYYVRIFLPHTSLSERDDFDRSIGRILPSTPRTNDFYRGQRKIYSA